MARGAVALRAALRGLVDELSRKASLGDTGATLQQQAVARLGGIGLRGASSQAPAAQLRCSSLLGGLGAASVRVPHGNSGCASASSAAAALLRQARAYRHLTFPGRGGSYGWSGADPDGSRTLWGLIAVNCGVFFLWRSRPGLCREHFTVSLDGLSRGRVYTLATAAVSQADFMHLAANMVALFFFGRDTARLFGGRRLLLLYLAGGVAGSLAHCAYFYNKYKDCWQARFGGRRAWYGLAPAALGASAAVNAVMVNDILLYPTRTVLLYGIIPMPAALLGGLWLMRDVTGTMDGGGTIAHAGHLGGAVAGLAFFLLFKRGVIRPQGWY